VNPRLRKIRNGLNLLGLPTDELLNHGAPRLVCGGVLAHNVGEYLLGRVRTPKSILATKDPRAFTERSARWWLRRWGLPRLESGEILARVARHTLVRSLTHSIGEGSFAGLCQKNSSSR
jgi:hypothetical protein